MYNRTNRRNSFAAASLIQRTQSHTQRLTGSSAESIRGIRSLSGACGRQMSVAKTKGGMNETGIGDRRGGAGPGDTVVSCSAPGKIHREEDKILSDSPPL